MKISFSTNGWDSFSPVEFFATAHDLEYDGVDIKIVCDAVIMKDEQRIIHYPTYLDISCEWEIRRRRDLDEQTNFHPLVIDICEIIQRHGGKNFNSKYTVPESAQKAGIPVWNMQLTPRGCNDSSNGITVPMESMYLLRN